jgi:hypothetical protein
VDCARPHLFEQAGPITLGDFRPGAPLPDDDAFRTLVNDRCTPLVSTYLRGRYDPSGAFRAGALKPSPKAWQQGERTLRCGLQRFSRSGALYPIVGPVAAQDQADVRPRGTCLGIDGKYVGDPVDCALPHAEESLGAVDLAPKFSSYPAPRDQDTYLQAACNYLAAGYAGGDTAVAAKHLVVIWNNLSRPSWAAGTRKVACNLAAVLPDKSGYAPIVGSARGSVRVGDAPAPPARLEVPPGSPAPADGKNDADADDDGRDAAPPPARSAHVPGPLPGGERLPSLPGVGSLPGNPLHLPREAGPDEGGEHDDQARLPKPSVSLPG